MSVRVDFEREIGHSDAEEHAEQVAEIQAWIKQDGQASRPATAEPLT